MNSEHIEITTPQGKLRGLLRKSAGVTQNTYYSFQGIPYAQPPVGGLRFKAPQPMTPWVEVRDATQEGNDSVQNHMLWKHPAGDEDCLYLNVYTPQPGLGAGQAVMVWIHGGAFSSGSGSSELYGPDYLVEQDVVLVTINYRCGALGFLSLENDKVPGNAGLKDQTMALRWVRDNIASFGGDPNNVTIFGESAGGASVHHHLLSPLSRGLFHKAILQSGFSTCPWALQGRPREKALLLARELGCSSQDPDQVLEFLTTVPAMDILSAQHKEIGTTYKDQVQTLSLKFIPCVEVAGDAPFLADTPRKLMERGEFSPVPVMMGITDKEGMMFVLKEMNSDKINEDTSVLVPGELKVAGGVEEERKVGREILQFYAGKSTLSSDQLMEYINFFTDIAFVLGLDTSRAWFLKHRASPVYTYVFTYTSPRNFSSTVLPSTFPDKASQVVGSGAGHGDDLRYLFKTNLTQIPFIPPTDEDQAFMDKFLKAWTTFAKTGNPNCPELGVTWGRDDAQSPVHLELGKVWTVVHNIPFPERVEFWRKMYEKYSYVYWK